MRVRQSIVVLALASSGCTSIGVATQEDGWANRPIRAPSQSADEPEPVAPTSSSGGRAENPKLRVLSETTRDLGFGFRDVTRALEMPPGFFEGVGHFGYLYFREQELSQTGTYSISPSGRYAVYQDGPSGDIVLFSVASREARVVQKYPHALVAEFRWSRGETEVSLRYSR